MENYDGYKNLICAITLQEFEDYVSGYDTNKYHSEEIATKNFTDWCLNAWVFNFLNFDGETMLHVGLKKRREILNGKKKSKKYITRNFIK